MAKTRKKTDSNQPGAKPEAAKAAPPKAKTAKKAKGGEDWLNKIVKVMVRPYRFGKNEAHTAAQLAQMCGCHERCQGFLAALKELAKVGLVEKQSNASYLLTVEGAAAAGYVKKEVDATGQRTNEEWHAYLKSMLTQNWKGAQIFDLLLKGPMTQKNLASVIGINERSHGFFYGLKELMEFGFVEKNSGKCELSAKAFIEAPEKRPGSKQEESDDSMDEDAKQEAGTDLMEDEEDKKQKISDDSAGEEED